MRKAIDDFNMIEKGDRVAVGLSGGKDSLVLLKALNAYRRFSPQPFDLFAVTIDMGIGNVDFTPLKEFCREEGVPYHIEKTDIGPIIFDIRKEKIPALFVPKCAAARLTAYLKP